MDDFSRKKEGLRLINEILHLLYSADILPLIMILSFLVYVIFLTAIRGKFDYYGRPTKGWVILCFVPLAAAGVHFGIYASGSAFKELFTNYENIYIPAALIALFPLLAKKRWLYNISKVATCFGCLFLTVLTISFASSYTNLTRKSMTDGYIALCDELEENYIMNDWKKIDYEKIKKEGLSKVEAAEKTGNTDLYYQALDELVYAFHDGHMGLSFYNQNSYEIDKLNSFNDYGMSLVKLDDGTTIAVDVEEGLDIKAGDVVTKWDGVDIDEAAEKVKPPMNEAVASNEQVLKTLFLSGVGGDTVTVSYIGEDGKERGTELSKIDSKFPRALSAASKLVRPSAKYRFAQKMLDDDTGYLYVGEESIDSISDHVGYLTGDHKKAREMFRADLQKLRDAGMTNLVIDIRGNGGGYDEVSTALASLFTEEKIYAFSLGRKDSSGITKLCDHYVQPDGEFSDIKVLVLTNMKCASAGDGMVLYMSRIEGVTIAGITEPSGCNQETGGHIYLPEGAVIDYPNGIVLDENGDPNIDVDDSRESRDPVDVKIPLDKEAALKIFDGTDYELEWAVQYLDG